MQSWGTRRCPTCGKTGHTMTKCTNCGTLGCSRSGCTNSAPGPNPCAVCKKMTKKVNP
jgi:hypothetical protein